MRIQVYEDSLKQIWNNFVGNSANSTFLFHRDYMDYHNHRFEDYSLLIWDNNDRLIALLPANRNGNKIISHEGLTYGGLVIDESMKTPILIEVFDNVLSYLRDRGFSQLFYKTIPYIYHLVPADEDKYALFLCNADLIRRSVLTVLNNHYRPAFQKRRTRGIKKATQSSLCVQESTDFESFWDVLTSVLLKYHDTFPIHNLAEIELLHSRFPKNIRLFTCYKEDILLAGVVVYESKKVAHVQYIASSNQGRDLCALDLLFDFLIKEVYFEKPFFDFGASDENSGYYLNKGLIDHKEGFGARGVVQDHYKVELSTFKSASLMQVFRPPSNSKV